MVRYYLAYQLKAVPVHHLDSPFLYGLTDAIKAGDHFYAFDSIEGYRNELLQRKEKLHITDHGAGSHHMRFEKRAIADIARHTLITPKWGQMMFRLIRHFNYSHILELGASLGISTTYLASVSHSSSVISIEGSESIAQVANQTLKDLGLANADIVTGTFNEVLPAALSQHNTWDLVFIDGHHAYAPTLDYFETCLPHIADNGVIVLDDIHWSTGMHKAWKEITERKDIGLTVDLFYKGLVFPHIDKVSQKHAVIRL